MRRPHHLLTILEAPAFTARFIYVFFIPSILYTHLKSRPAHITLNSQFPVFSLPVAAVLPAGLHLLLGALHVGDDLLLRLVKRRLHDLIRANDKGGYK